MEIKRRKNKKQKKRVKGVPLQRRRLKALQLRQQGMSYDRIGKALGVDIGTAYSDVMKSLDEIDEQRKEEADKLRTLEITRLDRLLEKLEEGIKKKTKKKVIKGKVYEIVEQDIDLTSFIMSYIRIMDRRARYIVGLDAPIKTEQDIGARLKEAMEQAGEDVVGILKRLAGQE